MPSIPKIFFNAGLVLAMSSFVQGRHEGNHYSRHSQKHGSSSIAALVSSSLSTTSQIALSSSIAVATTLSTIAIPSSSQETPSDATPASSTTSIPSPTTSSAAQPGDHWKPTVGMKWQIELTGAVTDTNIPVDVFDIDLFDTSTSTITTLHSLGKKVICYFSAGSYEDWRPDASSFRTSDRGNALDGWAGEWWLDTKSADVRSIMTARIELAKSKGCDGVDPDNVDGYDNDSGLSLTQSDAIDYLTFLAAQAHSRGLSIGLKNAGGLVDATLPIMEWQVNEQCLEYDECVQFQPFIDAGKPVFHIEYPSDAPAVSATAMEAKCDGAATSGFSTILKKLGLDAWAYTC